MGANGNQDRTYGHIDLSTGAEGPFSPHVERRYSLFTSLPDQLGVEKRLEWKFAIRIPRTVDKTLNSEDWDVVLRRLDNRGADGGFSPLEFIVFTARLAGLSSNAVQLKIGREVGNNLYRRFVMHQIKAGRQAWLTPTSMQRVKGPYG